MEIFERLTHLKGPDQASEGSRLCPRMTSENINLRGLRELDWFSLSELCGGVQGLSFIPLRLFVVVHLFNPQP